MFKTYSFQKMLKQRRLKLAIAGRHRQQFATSEPFGCAAFVDIDMRRVSADNRFVRLRHRLQTEYVCAGPAEHKENLYVITKVFAKFGDRAGGERIVTIGDDVAL